MVKIIDSPPIMSIGQLPVVMPRATVTRPATVVRPSIAAIRLAVFTPSPSWRYGCDVFRPSSGLLPSWHNLLASYADPHRFARSYSRYDAAREIGHAVADCELCSRQRPISATYVRL